MAAIFSTLNALFDHGYDTVIDVRSPDEFAEDHIPGAINLPVLSNAERAEVGTIYKQVSPFDARKLGAALVARNAADHIAGPLAVHDGGWRPLIYCWRGGQRSGSFTGILQQIGWRAEVIDGGYQTFRRLVHAAMYDTPVTQQIILLDGNTGTAKTDLLARLGAHGVQVIDLEGLANHRGSLLGDRPEGQPSQKAFESGIACAFASLDPARPVVIEAESSKIGKLVIPPSVWAAMTKAKRIEVTAPLEARAAYLTEAYADIIADPARLTAQLEPLKRHRGAEVIEGWKSQIREGRFPALAASLMEQHYDPAYAKSRAAHDPEFMARLHSDTLTLEGRAALAQRIAEVVRKP